MDKPTVIHGDSREQLKQFPDCFFDSVATDPPYALVSITKRFGADGAAAAKSNDAYMRVSAGFMGQQWDNGSTAFDPDFWLEVLRVLKPGAHLVAFGGTRTYHRLACAIEDAGFEIRDQLQWVFGSGFPKSHNLHGDHEGWGTALKPSTEPIVLARKPLSEKTVAANVLRWGTGALHVDACRVESDEDQRRPSSGGENGLAGTSTVKIRARHVDEQKIQGRWPANVLHDGSDDVLAGFPDSEGQQGIVAGDEPSSCHSGVYSGPRDRQPFGKRGDSGSAARFFYSPKADTHDRLGSKHPTVKPVDLMAWLVRLVTPVGGVVLDPFAGSGTTGEAAWREGCRAVLIEREQRFVDDITRRMALLSGSDRERTQAIVTAKGHTAAAGPLFDQAKP